MDITPSPTPSVAPRDRTGRRVPGRAIGDDAPDAARLFREALAARNLTGTAPNPSISAPPRTGRTLADYRAHTVQRIAPLDPKGDRAAPPSAGPESSVATRPPAAAKGGEPAAGAKAPEAHPAEGFAAAMMKGLDHYRAMQRTATPQPHVDLSQ